MSSSFCLMGLWVCCALDELWNEARFPTHLQSLHREQKFGGESRGQCHITFQRVFTNYK